MKLTYDYDEFRAWAGAVETWERIKQENKEDAFWQLMEDCYCESGAISETQVNDILWFDSEWVYEMLGIEEELQEKGY